MDIQRFILFLVFSFSVLFLWEAWHREEAPQPQAVTGKPEATGKAEVPAPSATPGAPAPAAPVAGGAAAEGAEVVAVETDVMRVEISLLGGELRHLEFLRHGGVEEPKRPFVLLRADQDRTYVAQSGLLGQGLPSHRSLYRAGGSEYQLQQGQDAVEVLLEADAGPGIKTYKRYRFRRGSYVVDVSHIVRNESPAAVEAHAYFQLLRDGKPPAGESRLAPTFTGVAVYTDQQKFQKLAFDEIAKGKHAVNATDGWIGMIQHYFLAAWLPENGAAREYYTKRVGEGLYSAGTVVPVGTVAPGAEASVAVRLYAGPQEQKMLAEIAPGLDLSVDYGWLTPIAVPLFWALNLFHGWVGNWGVAIILLTVLIKAAFYPLSAASYRSMAKMRLVAPKLQKIKEQYGDDRQRLHQAMMEIYKTEKINPLGGCLPILVQIPVFIALYWVLLASVELRHAPFMLWIEDLSASDPYYVLPIVMGLTMIIQTKMNPTPPDPIQARVMQIMPLTFAVFFFFFPAGLVLYWLVNNILSIIQQWHIMRTLSKAKSGVHGKA